MVMLCCGGAAEAGKGRVGKVWAPGREGDGAQGLDVAVGLLVHLGCDRYGVVRFWFNPVVLVLGGSGAAVGVG